MLDISKTCHRLNDILFDEDGNQILKFLEKENNKSGLTVDLVVNINNYIRSYPERIEKIEKKNVQLNLF